MTTGKAQVKKTEVAVSQDQREQFWSEQRKADEARRRVRLLPFFFQSS